MLKNLIEFISRIFRRAKKQQRGGLLTSAELMLMFRKER